MTSPLADHAHGDYETTNLVTSLQDIDLTQQVQFHFLELTTVAQQFAPHAGPTTLYLNFDGWSHYDDDPIWGCTFGCHSISPFATTTGNREQDIQEILFRTSELFAPFNVQVRRKFGDGDISHSNGNSTVFIGNDSGVSNTYAYTPFSHTDAPIRNRQLSLEPYVNPDGSVGVHYVFGDHQPNSDAWNYARVDPINNSNPAENWNNNRIARVVAHEAGHTFGLLHSRTVGSDPGPLDTTNTDMNPPEVMAYDSGSAYEYFLNQTFPLTIFNNGGSGTPHLEEGMIAEWDGERITHQNAYTYLQAVLAGRPSDDAANVAHRNYAGRALVDATYVDNILKNVGPGSAITDAIDRLGDYDVYQLGAVSGTNYALSISVTPSTDSTVDPVLQIFDDADGNLVAYNNDRSSGNPASGLTFQRVAGHTYKVVVGALNGGSIGYFRLSLANVLPKSYGSLSLPTSTYTTSTSVISTSLPTGSSLLVGAGSDEAERVVEPAVTATTSSPLPSKVEAPLPARTAAPRFDAKVADRVVASDHAELGSLDSDELFDVRARSGRAR